ncbi:MAG: O-methyltransferase [Fusobacteriaceae bacterium]
MLEELRDANGYIAKKIESKKKSELINELEIFAEQNNIPIVSKEVAEYLKFLVRQNSFKNILEIGTAIGYSGIIMLSESKSSDKKLTTIEIDQERFALAEKNFELAGFGKKNLQLIFGDATDVLPKFSGTFDFIFIDASKGQYQKFFDESYRLLSDNGIIFIDNIMFRGYLYKEYPKRFKTIVKNLDLFIDFLYKNHDVVLLPFGDGVALVRKNS